MPPLGLNSYQVMRNKTTYEWVLEPLDKHGDIVDPMHHDTLSGAVGYAPYFGAVGYDIGLVRNYGSDDDGLLDRGWCYINSAGLFDGELDKSTFRDVPKRFVKEVYAMRDALIGLKTSL